MCQELAPGQSSSPAPPSNNLSNGVSGVERMLTQAADGSRSSTPGSGVKQKHPTKITSAQNLTASGSEAWRSNTTSKTKTRISTHLNEATQSMKKLTALAEQPRLDLLQEVHLGVWKELGVVSSLVS